MVQVPCGQGRLLEPLVSRKVAKREVGTEGSGTKNFGTEEHEPDKRL